MVLGDKAAHRPCVHLMQPLYLFLFSVAFSSAHLVHHLCDLVKCSVRRPLRCLLLCCLGIALCVLVIATCTRAHPYLLADNRHFPFYLWRRVLSNPLYRHALAPVYFFAGALFVRALYSSFSMHSFESSHSHSSSIHTSSQLSPLPRFFQSLPLIRTLLFLFCTAVSVSFQELIEFRYFILPFLLYRVELARSQRTHSGRVAVSEVVAVLLELGFYLLVNVVTLYLFFYRPFKWAHEPHLLQRFMW